jgi:tRNA(Ile)-lysidine synthase
VSGIQAAARAARYRLMAEAMSRDGVEILATAHHLAYQAETVLMRLAHGSGIDGLRGMDALSSVEGCAVFRPLLGVRPEVLREVVSAAGLAPAHDPSNADENYERVRWRLMLPALEALGLTIERLGTFARRMNEASLLIHSEAEAAYPEIVTPINPTKAEINAGRFGLLNPAIATAILGTVLELVSGDRRPPPLGALELLAKRLQQPVALKGITLHGCLVSSGGDGVIWVSREGPRRSLAKRNTAITPN